MKAHSVLASSCGRRNYWLAMANQPRSYEGAQAYYMQKKASQWFAQTRLAAGKDAPDVIDVTDDDDDAGHEDESQRCPVERHRAEPRQQEIADEGAGHGRK